MKRRSFLHLFLLTGDKSSPRIRRRLEKDYEQKGRRLEKMRRSGEEENEKMVRIICGDEKR